MVALMMTEEALDRAALERARQAIERAIGACQFAVGEAESKDVRKALADAASMLGDVLHDEIDPALALIERQEADDNPTAFIREQAAMCRWHHGRLGL
ncbi:MAG TPA: hypothetical protein VIK75_10200 [Calditerricola sp.]